MYKSIDPRFALPDAEIEPCSVCSRPTHKAVPETLCDECLTYFRAGFNVFIPEVA